MRRGFTFLEFLIVLVFVVGIAGAIIIPHLPHHAEQEEAISLFESNQRFLEEEGAMLVAIGRSFLEEVVKKYVREHDGEYPDFTVLSTFQYMNPYTGEPTSPYMTAGVGAIKYTRTPSWRGCIIIGYGRNGDVVFEFRCGDAAQSLSPEQSLRTI